MPRGPWPCLSVPWDLIWNYHNWTIYHDRNSILKWVFSVGVYFRGVFFRGTFFPRPGSDRIYEAMVFFDNNVQVSGFFIIGRKFDQFFRRAGPVFVILESIVKILDLLFKFHRCDSQGNIKSVSWSMRLQILIWRCVFLGIIKFI